MGTGVYFWQEQKMKEKEMEDRLDQIEKQVDKKGDPSGRVSDAGDEADGGGEEPAPGWEEYDNDRYNYVVDIPEGAIVEEVPMSAFSLSMEDRDAGVTFEEIYRRYGGQICISIRYGVGVINISAPENLNYRHVICGRSGVGGSPEMEIREKTENLTIDGRAYIAEGSEFVDTCGDTLDCHNETMTVRLEDNTQIQYGVSGGAAEGSTWADYLRIRDDIIQIVESYRAD